jgi:hypothetical protein
MHKFRRNSQSAIFSFQQYSLQKKLERGHFFWVAFKFNKNSTPGKNTISICRSLTYDQKKFDRYHCHFSILKLSITT